MGNILEYAKFKLRMCWKKIKGQKETADDEIMRLRFILRKMGSQSYIPAYRKDIKEIKEKYPFIVQKPGEKIMSKEEVSKLQAIGATEKPVKMNYAPGTFFIIKFTHPLIPADRYSQPTILSKSKNLIVVKNGTHGNAQNEFSMPKCCRTCKERVLSLLN